MKKGIFRRIFIVHVLILFLAVLFVEIYITAALRENYINHLKQNLSVQINLISKGISFTQTGLDTLCREIKKETGARVTVIANDGKVMGDSDTDSALMDNHLHRTE
ncbi:MAG: hypothetical protein COW52_09540, partial [Nitrospirae bacterium CG17_big_fil_post_rev_8_21_14_2_50_50_9]